MRIHRSHPESGFTMIPNTTLQDQRLSMTARGLLADILSRPDGWQTNADAMVEQAHRTRPNAAEGRRAMRAAYAELEALGYLVRTKLRGPDGMMRTEIDIYDTPQNAHRGTGSGMSVTTSGNVHSPRSHRGTAYRPSVSGTSIQRQNTKTDENKEIDAAGAASLSLNADALSMENADADASTAAGKPAARTDDRPAKPKPPTLDQRLDAHLAALGPDVIDEMYRDLDNDRMGIVEWAVKKARKNLALSWDIDPEDEPGGQFARKAVGLVLMRLTKADGGGLTPTVEGLLGDFDWPDERTPSAYQAPKSSIPRPRTDYYPIAKGADLDTVLRKLYRAVSELDPAERELMGAEFHASKPRIFGQCEESAKKQLDGPGVTPSPDELLDLTIKYGLHHYGGKWPTFLVPEHLRPKPSADAA